MHPNPFTAAGEFVERELTRCQSLGRTRADEQAAGARLCQILELLDFHEWHQLHPPLPHAPLLALPDAEEVPTDEAA